MIIDTHTHLYLPEFEADRREVIQRAIDSGVEMMIFPNVDLTTITMMHDLASAYPAMTRMAMGLHPTEVSARWRDDLGKITSLLTSSTESYVAVGEIGMDLYWDKTFKAEQAEAFRLQAELAVELGLPVIIHCREALGEILEVLDTMKEVPQGVFHSFGGTVDDVKAIRRRGDFYFGINGILTFKNSRLSSVLPEIGIDRILLETDAPYLAPVPYRGKRNETSFITATAEAVGKALDIPAEEVAHITSSNARQLFKL
ncbi:MAG: TatD family hydrolase [Lachnoclostridium sp.]|nr:TatD family hydrolase [Lachnoclostridium sp.]